MATEELLEPEANFLIYGTPACQRSTEKRSLSSLTFHSTPKAEAAGQIKAERWVDAEMKDVSQTRYITTYGASADWMTEERQADSSDSLSFTQLLALVVFSGDAVSVPQRRLLEDTCSALSRDSVPPLSCRVASI
ncbi:hypothetical protein AAFF_G00312930 [Aldrovandia affinis]|uniref:Uncharacterized protein n=1 Tax=Aldrovandia affinis TaxID=143900 RepID=A0AAD7SNK4_9TELE|nr:hypothetical protein AAFF_G00312930 [Aldrovandia affinis]